MRFPFQDSKNVAVITCIHVLEKSCTICYVSHDEEDGCWQFLCGDLHDDFEARIVALEEIFELDPSVGVLADMPLGSMATRDDTQSPWKRFDG